MNNYRGYIFSRPFLNENYPQKIQNLVIRDYVKKTKGKYLLSITEYAMKNSYFAINNYLNSNKNHSNHIVFFSAFMLPMQKSERIMLIEKILNKGVELHFAKEDIAIKNYSHIKGLDELFMVKFTLSNCLTNLKKYVDV